MCDYSRQTVVQGLTSWSGSRFSRALVLSLPFSHIICGVIWVVLSSSPKLPLAVLILKPLKSAGQGQPPFVPSLGLLMGDIK